jgi:hypothetical protein
MAVKFTKPEINVREKLAELDKPSGIAGEAMLRAETPQEQFNLIGAGRRNILINGAFQVWQRGTSSTSFTGATRGYIADRWSFRYATSAERSTDVPGGEAFKYSIKVVVASTSPDSFIIQAIEDSDRFAGQTVTLSYWIKPSESCELRADYYRTPHGIHEINGNVWQKVTNTFVVPSDITVNEFLYIQFPANKVITFYITGIQLELGKVATPFEHRSFGEELVLCKRYYEKSFNYDDAPANGSTTTSLSTNAGRNFCEIAIWSKQASRDFEVEKRASPTITRYGNSQGYWGYLSAGTSAPASVNTFAFHQNLIIQTDSKRSVCANNQVSGNPLWGLIGHWTADAEL